MSEDRSTEHGLRIATRSDIIGMMQVRHAVRENRLVAIAIGPDAYAEAIETTGRGFVVEEAGEVIGFAVGNERTGNIWALFVDPRHERKGHGRRLLDALVAWLWSRGFQRLSLTTAPNTRAAGFYVAAGWRATGPVPGGETRFELSRPVG